MRQNAGADGARILAHAATGNFPPAARLRFRPCAGTLQCCSAPGTGYCVLGTGYSPATVGRAAAPYTHSGVGPFRPGPRLENRSMRLTLTVVAGPHEGRV